jgi:cell division septation protein DedD
MQPGRYDSASIRNLDQIQEQEPAAASSRLVALVMASFGGACIVFAALALMRSPESGAAAAADPLSELAARADKPAEQPRRLDTDDVTFPQVLSDQENPTTAMAAVRGQRGEDDEELPREPLAAEPPPAADQLPVVPLPAQDVLSWEGRSAPGDRLRAMAHELSREPESGPLTEAGHPGGYQLQVSSFQKPEDAAGFAMALRRRGHKAHVEQAHVKGRGLWHRVRIGPFKYRRSAEIYRQDFEAKERMVTFVVDPPKATIRIGPAAPEDDSP